MKTTTKELNRESYLIQVLKKHGVEHVFKGADAVQKADLYGRIQGLGAAYVDNLDAVNVNQLFIKSSPAILIQELNGDITDNHIDIQIKRCISEKRPVLIQELLPSEEAKTTEPESLNESIQEIKKLLKEADMPIILVGHQVQRHGMHKEVVHFAEKYHIPMAATPLGKSSVSEHHPLYMGIYPGTRTSVNNYIESADLVILIGVTEKGFEFSRKQRIQATFQDIQVNRHHYTDIVFSDFVLALSLMDSNIRFRGTYPSWIDEKTFKFQANAGSPISFQRILQCLQKYLGREHLVVTELDPRIDLLVHEGGFFTGSQMGAAALASPKKRVIGLTKEGVEISEGNPIVIHLGDNGIETEEVFEEALKNALKSNEGVVLEVKLPHNG